MSFRLLKRGAKTIVVLVGVTVLTSFSIDATDTFRSSNTMLSQLIAAKSGQACEEGMVQVTANQNDFCIDAYENAYSESCPYQQPRSTEEAKVNADSRNCVTVSEPAVPVATFVTYQFAQTMCAKRGARLPTAGEWSEAALGTPDTGDCNTNGVRASAGTYASCRSLYGVADMIGNVWEWVDGAVIDGVFNGTKLASEGYVSAVDTRGLPTESSDAPDLQFNGDYVWSEAEGTYAAMRGGFYGSENDAGLYTLHAKMNPGYGSEATGFRCVRSM